MGARSPFDALSIEWSRKLAPSNYCKPTAAQYKTAPNIVLKGSPDYPEDAPDGSVTISFFLDSSSWLKGTDGTFTAVTAPIAIMKQPKSKRSKHGPVLLMDADTVYAAVAASENYYYAAYELTKHRIARMVFKPGVPDGDGAF